jgi:hypothetical protein
MQRKGKPEASKETSGGIVTAVSRESASATDKGHGFSLLAMTWPIATDRLRHGAYGSSAAR